MKNLVDCHAHSNNSFDADHSVEQMVKKATSLNLHTFCITDHCDFYLPGENKNTNCFDGDPIEPIIQSFTQMKECVINNNSDTELLCGVEVGQANQNPMGAKNLFSKCDFDFVLGSLHNLSCEQDFFFMEYDKLDVEVILHRYFYELIEMCELGMFDSLAHLTYPLRYITGEYKIKVNLDRYSSLIDKILTLLIKNGKALEVNSSGLRQKYGDILPHAEILTRYKQLGGEFITVGSDAHKTINIGKGIATVYETLIDCGFDKITVFKKRKPQQISIT